MARRRSLDNYLMPWSGKFGTWLIEERRKRNWDRCVLAKKSGVNENTLRALEKNIDRHRESKILKKILKALDYTEAQYCELIEEWKYEDSYE